MTRFIKKIRPLLLFQTALFFAVAAFYHRGVQAAESPEGKRFNVDNGVVLHGYDPISYFTDKTPAVGKSDIKFSAGGATYLFASQEHLEAFKKDPLKYEPQYGGWCAYAMANGDFVDIDPKSYKITDGKLFLFYNGFWGNTLQKWNKDESALYPKAQEQWANVLKSLKAGK